MYRMREGPRNNSIIFVTYDKSSDDFQVSEKHGSSSVISTREQNKNSLFLCGKRRLLSEKNIGNQVFKSFLRKAFAIGCLIDSKKSLLICQ